MRKRILKAYLKACLEVLIVEAVTLVLFKLGRDAAYVERGYRAIGGEYCILFILPYLWFGIRRTLRGKQADQDGWSPARKDKYRES